MLLLFRNLDLVRKFRLNKKREILRQQIDNDFCDHCNEYKVDLIDRKGYDERLINLDNQKMMQNNIQNSQNTTIYDNEDDLASIHVFSYSSCDQTECSCRKRCRIAKLIKDNISTRSNNSSNLNQMNRQLFDNEYRRLIRRNRQLNKSIDNETNCANHKNNLKNDFKNNVNSIETYASWSSHLHIHSPVL